MCYTKSVRTEQAVRENMIFWGCAARPSRAEFSAAVSATTSCFFDEIMTVMNRNGDRNRIYFFFLKAFCKNPMRMECAYSSKVSNEAGEKMIWYT